MNKAKAIYVEKSKNEKIGLCDATYVPIENTCPNTCSLKSAGCYAQSSFVGIINGRLQKAAKNDSPLDVAKVEAKTINESYDGKEIPENTALRLHVSGDSRTIKGTRILNKAIEKWKNRGGKYVWSYTHAWRHVPRNEWNNVSILASIDSIEDAKKAIKQGYAPAIVVSEFSSDKVFKMKNSNIKWIPCPAQTRNITCTSCKLCFNANRLFENNFGIAFAAHGVSKNNIKKRLNVLQ